MGNLLNARFRQLDAQRAARKSLPTLPILNLALAAARRADAVHSVNTDAIEELARVTLRLCEATAPPPAVAQLAAGRAIAERALKLNPNLAQGHALRGAFLLRQGEQTATPPERLALLSEARESFTQALASNPSLQREYEPYLKKLTAVQPSR